MSKKKIILFGNAWGEEYFQMIFRGVKEYAEEHIIDVDVFITYSTDGMAPEDKAGEMNIFRLPDIKQYDGAIVLANSINVAAEKEYIREQLLESGIPAICLEYELPGLSYMGSENYSGMYELAEHLFKDHGYKEILYISGPKDHNEAMERLKAVRDAAKQYGVVLNKDNIRYGDWSYRSGLGFLHEYIERVGKIPQAIICANDGTARGIMQHLPYTGYVPGYDIAVTGFDCLKQGAVERPSLTSVGRNWDDMGKNAMKVLFEEEWDVEKPKRIIMNSQLVKRESCGCLKSGKDSLFSEIELKKKTREMGFISSVELDIHMRALYQLIFNCRTARQLHEKLSGFIIQDGHYYETDTFCVCLNPHFFEEVVQDKYKVVDHLDRVLAISTVYDGKPYDIEEIEFPNIVPNAFANRDKSNVLFYVPFHLDGIFAGYAVMKGFESQISNSALFVWTRHMMQYLQQIRQNVQIDALTARLERLSATDGLTGLFNRRGCNDIVRPYYEQCKKDGKGVAFVMCDVDDMKEINDQFGHLQGDFAICTLANAISDSIEDSWYACRYGGDEFIVIGLCDSKQEMQALLKKIEDCLQSKVIETKAPFKLQASIGGAMIHPDDEVSFEMAIKLADDNMYRIKSEHKLQSGGRVR